MIMIVVGIDIEFMGLDFFVGYKIIEIVIICYELEIQRYIDSLEMCFNFCRNIDLKV